jgi:hypothetical protein
MAKKVRVDALCDAGVFRRLPLFVVPEQKWAVCSSRSTRPGKIATERREDTVSDLFL